MNLPLGLQSFVDDWNTKEH